MLHEFITSHHLAIVARTRQLLVDRGWPAASSEALDRGVPLFLAQVSEILEKETTTSGSSTVMDGTATRHGGDLLALGFTASQVVHAYGDVCQVVTAIAIEENAPIAAEEFRILNRCLDQAIADAVTEHARRTAESRSAEEVERIGRLIHEVRNLLNTGLLAYEALKRGDVAIGGSTGAVLGRSLIGLRTLVDTTVLEMSRLTNHDRRERVSLDRLLSNLASDGALDAESRGVSLSCEVSQEELSVTVDPQLLSSAVNNLLSNAFKYTPAGGHVVMRAHRDGSTVAIEVEDQCGGIPDSEGDPFRAFGDRRGADRTGLGLGLSIARRAVRAGGGDIRIRNTPGKGCTFIVELPSPAADARPF